LKYVQAWQAKRLYWNVFAFNRQMEQQADAIPGRIMMDVGQYDAELGVSYGEIAGISRSQHRSQGMGAAERKGAMPQHLTWVAGEKAATDLFDGIDATWNRLPGGGDIATSLAAIGKGFPGRKSRGQPSRPRGHTAQDRGTRQAASMGRTQARRHRRSDR
jgi:hypothetical protein